MSLEERFRVALGVSSASRDPDALVRGRLVALGHGVACPRCGGDGRYSWNAMHGSVCYGCAGRGIGAPRLSESLLATVTAQVAAGDLERVLEERRRQRAIRQAAAGARDRVLAAWRATGVEAAYNWRSDAEADRLVSEQFNAPMCRLYDAVSAVAADLESLEHRARSSGVAQADIDAAAVAVADAERAALAGIAELGRALERHLADRVA